MPRSYARRSRRPARSRRPMRRKRPYRKAKIPRTLLPANMVHSFTRSAMPTGYAFVNTVYTNPYLSAADGWVFYGGTYWTLQDVRNYTEFTNLFDQYRILGVKMTLYPQSNTAEAGTQSDTSLPRGIPTLTWAIDLDDSSTPTELQVLMEDSRSHTRYFNKPVSIFLKPRAHNTIAGSAQALLPRGTWVDSNYDQVPYYGVKFGIHVPSPNPSTQTPWFAFKTQIKIYLQCRHAK